VVPDKMNPLAWLRKHLDDEGGNDHGRAGH
jgi:hypothetical protein